MLKVTVIDRDFVSYFDHIALRWNALFRSCSAEPSTSLQWTRALFLNHLGQSDKFYLILFEENERLVSVIPIVLRIEKIFGIKYRHAFAISELYNTHSDILAENIDKPLVTLAFRKIITIAECDFISFSRIRQSSALGEIIDSYNEHTLLPCITRPSPPSFYLDLPNSYDGYLASRTAKFRNYLRRMTKKLNKLGEVKIEFFTGPDEFDRCYRDILNIEETSWKHSHGTAISAINRQKRFYYQMCKDSSFTGELHAMILYLDNKPLSYNMGYLKNHIYYYLKTSFDEEFRKYSPATVIRNALIEDLIHKGYTRIDFPGEPFEWETQWTNELEWHHMFILFANNFRARLLFNITKLRNYMKRNKDEVLKFSDPRDIVA